MERRQMADHRQEFANQAAAEAIATLEEELIQASRAYEDAERYGYSAGDAVTRCNKAKVELDALTGANQPRQAQQQLSPAAQQYLQKRVAGGETLSPARWQDYLRGHQQAVAAGWQPDTPQYFAAVSGYVDHLGDGRQPPLDEREVCKMLGLSEDEYAAQAQKLRALKAQGHYGDR
jgi:hypothetical protein